MNGVVTTSYGTLAGGHRHGVEIYLGIPYAAPPVGRLRFQAPEPPEPWPGVRQAVVFGPDAPQPAMLGFPPDPDDTEWLTVNVWAPEHDGPLPVMVWIHGGAYMFGSSNDPRLDSTRLALAGPVVVVTLNYRLGVEGFATIAGAPHNRGLLDVLAALRWVRSEIAAFGGDPDNITVFGQSAGAGITAALLTTPAAAGLFHRAIASSIPATFLTPELAGSVSAELARRVGRPAEVDAMSVLEPHDLSRSGISLMRTLTPEWLPHWGRYALTLTPFSPIVEPDTPIHNPWDAARADGLAAVPLIAGHTRDEYRQFRMMIQHERGITKGRAGLVVEQFGHGVSYRQVVERLRAEGSPTGPEWVFEDVMADWYFRLCSAELARLHAANGHPSWLYELALPTTNAGLGVPHAADNALLFGTFTAHVGLYSDKVPAHRRISHQLQAAWTGFARTGEAAWPALAPPDDMTSLVIDEQPSPRPYPHADRLTGYGEDDTATLDLPG